MASLFHPLCGSKPETLLRLLRDNGPIASDRLPQVAIALTVALARYPFSIAEQVLFDRLHANSSSVQAPVFIVGYWRSGTTHLHNLLSRDRSFGYISPLATGLPWDILGIVSTLEPLLEKALPHDRYVDNVAVTPDSPQEDSIPLASMGAPSYYHGLYFPQHFKQHFYQGVFFEGCDAAAIDQWRRYHTLLLQKVAIQQQGKPLLIKNPVYTAHISRLRQLWPDAKFIHIYRNPYIVFPSTQHFFTRLLPELALQDCPDLPLTEIILDSYPRMMQRLQTDRAALPTDSFVEVRFEDLEARPLEQLEIIYQTLNLKGFEQARPQFQTYLDSLHYRKNQYNIPAETLELVQTSWQPFIEQWGYTAPAASDL